jgi:uncharacterized RDD family membrane protein YckC
MLPENPMFLVRGEDGGEYGPVHLTELREWVQENRAGLGTEVKRFEPNAAWQQWQHFPELVALLAEVNATTDTDAPVTLGLVLAPLWRRALAFSLDFILISFLFTPIFAVIAIVYLPDWCRLYIQAAQNPPFIPPDLPTSAEAALSMVVDSLMALYFALFQTRHGQTPAKQLLRVRVVNQAGLKPDFLQAFWRAILLIISMNLFCFPMLYAFFNPQRRTLHDIIAGTYVVEA